MKKQNNTSEAGEVIKNSNMLIADNAWKEQNVRKIDKVVEQLNKVKSRINKMKKVRLYDAFAIRKSLNTMVGTLPKIDYCTLEEGEQYEAWWL